jgi:CDP-diacylglycerol---serine O-phosphatidyltransferase
MNESPVENDTTKTNEPAPRHRRMGRSIFVLPSIFTVGNIFCGYYSILLTMYGNYDFAAKAIGIAIILDMLDGRIARLTNSTSGFGLQLDSLADVISFGIAPSILVLEWGLPAIDQRFAWITAFTFTICGAMRLARFNVQAGGLKHFVGLPIPAGGGMIAALVHFFPAPIINKLGGSLMVACIFILSFLMVSTIRYSSMKHLTLGKKSHFTILVIAMLVVLIFFLSKQTLLAAASIYVISGPLIRLYSLIRRPKSGEELSLADSAQQH